MNNKVTTRQSSREHPAKQGSTQLTANDSPSIAFTSTRTCRIRTRTDRGRRGGGIFSKVLVVAGVDDGQRWIADSQVVRSEHTGSVVAGSTVDGEAGRLVDE